MIRSKTYGNRNEAARKLLGERAETAYTVAWVRGNARGAVTTPNGKLAGSLAKSYRVRGCEVTITMTDESGFSVTI